MAERFERLYKLPENLYIDGAPIIISAGALLKDTATGSVVAQLKFHSVTKNIIKAVKVSLCAYDVSNSEIEGVNDYQYLDLSVRNGQEFGSNKAIVLPQAITRSFYISDITIVFSDDTKWRCEDPAKFKQLPLPKLLSVELHNAELEKQYKLSTTPSATYVPFETMSVWNCTCGEWNSDSKCTKCGSARQTVFSAFDTENLQTAANNRIAAEQAQREEDARIAAEAEIKRKELEAKKKIEAKKRNKILTIVGTPLLIVLLLFAFWINPYVIRYSNAVNLIEEKQYEKAYELFSKLKTYKDSESYLAAFEWVCVEEYASGDYLSKYEYNEKGKLLYHSKQYYKYDTLDSTYEYIYDNNDLLSKVVKKDDDGEIDATTEYFYNEEGLLSEEHDDWTYHEYLTKYSYDENGYLICEEYFQRDKDKNDNYVFTQKTTYSNDSDGKVIEKTVIDDNNKETKYRYTYDKKGLCSEWERLSDQKKYKYDRTFDDYGRVVSCFETRLDGSTQTITYKYALIFNKEKLDTLVNPKSVYAQAEKLLKDGAYEEAILKFESLGDYKDCKERIDSIYELIKEKAYSTAITLFNEGNYEDAIVAFTELGEYKDSSKRIEEAKAAINESNYQKAIGLQEAKKYDEAIAIFESLGEYKDSAAHITESKNAKCAIQYANAESLLSKGKKSEAAIAFGKISGYSDARARSLKLWEDVAQRDTIATGYRHTVGLKNNGTVVSTGSNKNGQCNVSKWADIVAISAGCYHTVGLKSDGTVLDTCYQDTVKEWTDIVAIAAGRTHTVGLKIDGTVVVAGSGGTPNAQNGWTDIVAISAGIRHTVGLKSNGKVVATGDNDEGQCNVSNWSDIVAIGAGWTHTLGVKSDGSVVAVGRSYYDILRLSDWNNIVAVTGGHDHSIGLKSNGTVVSKGADHSGECSTSRWSNVVAVSANFWQTVALKSNGTVVATGENDDGQCNVANWTNIKTPN